jgi:plasmid maintenance system antidote protein VapI
MAKRRKRTATTLADQLRAAIDASGKSRYELCKLGGVDQSVLGRFMSGQRGLTLDVADRLCKVLGLVLRRKAGE